MIKNDHDTNAASKTGVVTQKPTHGSVGSWNASNDTFTYTPNNGYTGRDSFKFQMKDDQNTLSEEKIIDFLALYINSISGSATVKLFGANSNFILLDSDCKYFYTSYNELFITGDLPNTFFTEIASYSVSSTGWNILDLVSAGYSNGIGYKHFLVQFTGTFTIGLGEVLRGQKTEPTFNPTMGREYGKEDNVFIKEAYDGTEFSFKSGDSNITRKFNWDAVSDTDKTSFERLRNESHHKKFVYYDGTNYHFVKLADMEIGEVAYGMNNVSMSFAE